MKVTKRTVEMFQVGDLSLDRDEAMDLYRSLAFVLGVPATENKGCGDRMSHGGHHHGTSERFYCSGRSFDAT